MKSLKNTRIQTIIHLKQSIAIGLLVAITLVSMPVQVYSVDAAGLEYSSGAQIVNQELLNSYDFTLPEYSRVKVVRTYRFVPMTAYTSRPEETDSTPFITADGSHVRDGIVACNFLPFGTKVRIPELFGDKIFEVHDRMNRRYPYKMDFWMEDLGDARRFGVKRAHIEIVHIESYNNELVDEDVLASQ